MTNAGTPAGQALDPAPSAVPISLNGAPDAVPEGSTVGDLLVRLGLPRERVAVELNGEIVRKAAYDGTRIEPGARLEVVSFVGGG